MACDLFVVVIGCGRLGSHLANHLSGCGHGVVTVDCDERAFSNLSAGYCGFRVEGDATELAVLQKAKMASSDLVIATTRDDNINLMVAQVARSMFSVPRVLARVFNPRREAIYKRLGIETICPTAVSGELFLQSISKDTARERTS